MSDKYTDEELEAIKAYEGKVNIIKRGQSAIPVEGKSWLEGTASFHRRNSRIQKFAISKERDEIIREMTAINSTISEIARQTGLSRESVKARIKRLKIKGYEV